MTEPGKNAPGLKGFPTPDVADAVQGYLLLYFQDKKWAQYALGALKNLEVAYNWYKSGELDVDEAAEAFRLINQQAPLNKLPSCSLPTGQPLMRVDPTTGNIQEVDDEGNWQDAALPSPTGRTEPTDAEKLCNGVANATNALSLLYESLSDSFNSGLSTAEAITAFITTVGTALAVEFAPPAAALIAIGGLLFEVVYAVVEFVSADVWDNDFSDKLKCYMLACASLTGDVVHIDYNCLIDQLAAQTNVFDLSFTQLRLFGQLNYILSWIGSQGLDYAAGETTLSGQTCVCEWCARIPLAGSPSVVQFIPGSGGAFAGGGIQPTVVYVGGNPSRPRNQAYCKIAIDLSTIILLKYTFTASYAVAVSGFATNGFAVNNYATVLAVNTTGAPAPTYQWVGSQTGVTEIDFNIGVGANDSGSGSLGSGEITEIEIHGVGDMPSQLLDYIC